MFVPAFLMGSALADDNAFGSLISDNVDNSSVSIPFEQGQVIDMTLHPLIRNATASNTLMGVMISPQIKIALIRTQSGDNYFVRIGDKLGNAEGVITAIKSDGIEVTEDSEVISLDVRNRSVSNEAI
jgi:type IV pilus assembly protein PilP